MANIIIPDRPGRFGRTRSEQEKNLRKEGMTTLSDAQLDKCKYLEKRAREHLGVRGSYCDKSQIDQVR